MRVLCITYNKDSNSATGIKKTIPFRKYFLIRISLVWVGQMFRTLYSEVRNYLCLRMVILMTPRPVTGAITIFLAVSWTWASELSCMDISIWIKDFHLYCVRKPSSVSFFSFYNTLDSKNNFAFFTAKFIHFHCGRFRKHRLTKRNKKNTQLEISSLPPHTL